MRKCQTCGDAITDPARFRRCSERCSAAASMRAWRTRQRLGPAEEPVVVVTIEADDRDRAWDGVFVVVEPGALNLIPRHLR